MMRFVLQTPSLQHLAEVKVVTCLWTQRALFIQIAASVDEKKVDAEVESKVWALPLPKPCKKQLLSLVKPLGSEIFKWSKYHCINEYVYLEHLLPHQLCWTMHGTIDYGKTAELMLKYERLSVDKRFELACINCLESEARDLIGFIAEERRRRNYMNKVYEVYNKEHRVIILYFTCNLTGNADQLNRFYPASSFQGDSFIKRLFQAKVQWGTRATCKYLFTKLSPREKNQVLVQDQKDMFYCNTSPSCSILYYLSLMSEEQQENMFRESLRFVLECLLDWPMQSLFMETLKHGWKCMECHHHRTYVFSVIIDKIRCGYKNNYCQLFWEFWRLSPAAYQQFYLEDIDIFSGLLETKREECIKLIFNEAPSMDLNAYFYFITDALMDESAICDAALMECKERAALNSSIDQEDEDKRLRSKYISRIVNRVIKDRIKETV